MPILVNGLAGSKVAQQLAALQARRCPYSRANHDTERRQTDASPSTRTQSALPFARRPVTHRVNRIFMPMPTQLLDDFVTKGFRP